MKTLIAVALTLALSLPTAALAQHMDINELIAGIGGTDFLKAAEKVDSAPAVRVVALSSLAGATAASGRLADAEGIKREDLEYLHANLYLNPIARAAIRNAGFSIEQIVTLVTPPDGATTLFANDL